MSKKKLLRNSPLYLLTAANIIYAVQHGFNWLTWFAIGLTLIVFVWDIVEVFKRGKKQKWDSTGIYEENYVRFPLDLRPEVLEAFRAACEKNGTKPTTEIKNSCEYIEKAGE